MALSRPERTIPVALLGNPNTGKSTLFSSLVGVRQRTGNYPGVTVEKKLGRMSVGDRVYEIIDLPGTYSLAPHSPDEMVAVDVLLGRLHETARPQVIVCIVDASNLSRNLYLVSQLLELQRPMVLALNMTDVAAAKGIEIDDQRLSQSLGIPVVPIQANRKVGLEALKSAIVAAADQTVVGRSSPLPEALQHEVSQLEQLAGKQGKQLPRYLCERLILDTGYLQSADIEGLDDELRAAARTSAERLTSDGQSLAALETIARYQWVGQMTEGVIRQHDVQHVTWSDRLDRVMTHRVLGPLVFVMLMLVIFQAVFSGAVTFMDAIENGIGWVSDWVGTSMSDGPLQSLIVNGLLGGVGAVLVFLPQILILFFFIAVMEDCGYMARAAFLMDRLMSRVGLSGKSFIPLLSSFACAVPGIMATRVIENRRDRLVTILIAPLMTCSARLPVYVLLIAAFIPSTSLVGFNLLGVNLSIGLQNVTMVSLYALGIVAAILVAVALRKTILPGEAPPFVMELPSYKLPDVRVVTYRMLERGWAFVYRAGTLIFAVTILVWAAGYYPRNSEQIEGPIVAQREALTSELAAVRGADPASDERINELEKELSHLDNQLAGAHLRQSYLGRSGRWIEPIVKPLGWDWRIGCAVVASFPAREVVVGTLGVIYNLGDEEDSIALRDSLRQATWDGSDRKVFNTPVALSIMVFFALCAQCVSTIAVIKRETNSWRWAAFSFVYMTVLAYVGAFLTYQVGSLLI